MVQCDRVVGFLLRIIVKYTSLGLGVGGRAQAFLVALLTYLIEWLKGETKNSKIRNF